MESVDKSESRQEAQCWGEKLGYKSVFFCVVDVSKGAWSIELKPAE